MAPRKGTKKKNSDSDEPARKKSASDGSASRVRRPRNLSPTQRVTRSVSASSSARLESLPEPPAKKRAKKLTEKEKVEVAEEAPAAGGAGDKNVKVSKTIVIEHCKQCNQIKVRAMQVKSGLEASIPDIKVLVNPKKPRFGCFEIREEDGAAFLTIMSMKRPFVELKALDMDRVVADIVEKLK